jgi:hypothetical protein
MSVSLIDKFWGTNHVAFEEEMEMEYAQQLVI